MKMPSKKKAKKPRKENPWLTHVKKVKKKNPKMKFKEVLMEAKESYNK